MLTYKTKKKEQWGFVMNTEIWNPCYRWQLQTSITSVSNLFPFVVVDFFFILLHSIEEILAPYNKELQMITVFYLFKQIFFHFNLFS